MPRSSRSGPDEALGLPAAYVPPYAPPPPSTAPEAPTFGVTGTGDADRPAGANEIGPEGSREDASDVGHPAPVDPASPLGDSARGLDAPTTRLAGRPPRDARATWLDDAEDDS